MAERTRDATRARVVARRALVLLTVTLAALLPSATDGAGALVLPSVVTPVAGTGISGYDTGEGGVATTARFAAPVAVATPAGELVVADGDNCRVRLVDAGGIVSDLAGDGTCGFAGWLGPCGLLGSVITPHLRFGFANFTGPTGRPARFGESSPL